MTAVAAVAMWIVWVHLDPETDEELGWKVARSAPGQDWMKEDGPYEDRSEADFVCACCEEEHKRLMGKLGF